MSKITSGVVLFSLLMALSLGVAFAESEVAETMNVTENATNVTNVTNNTNLTNASNVTISINGTDMTVNVTEVKSE
jgi:hypothetical protein